MSESRKRKLIETLLKLSRQWQVYQATVEQSFGILNAKYYYLAEEEINRIREDFGEEELIEGLLDVYEKHLEGGDIEQLIKFYSSDLGKKMIENSLLRDLADKSLQWVNKLQGRFEGLANSKRE